MSLRLLLRLDLWLGRRYRSAVRGRGVVVDARIRKEIQFLGTVDQELGSEEVSEEVREGEEGQTSWIICPARVTPDSMPMTFNLESSCPPVAITGDCSIWTLAPDLVTMSCKIEEFSPTMVLSRCLRRYTT
jgi:hypothetical protein